MCLLVVTLAVLSLVCRAQECLRARESSLGCTTFSVIPSQPNNQCRLQSPNRDIFVKPSRSFTSLRVLITIKALLIIQKQISMEITNNELNNFNKWYKISIRTSSAGWPVKKYELYVDDKYFASQSTVVNGDISFQIFSRGALSYGLDCQTYPRSPSTTPAPAPPTPATTTTTVKTPATTTTTVKTPEPTTEDRDQYHYQSSPTVVVDAKNSSASTEVPGLSWWLYIVILAAVSATLLLIYGVVLASKRRTRRKGQAVGTQSAIRPGAIAESSKVQDPEEHTYEEIHYMAEYMNIAPGFSNGAGPRADSPPDRRGSCHDSENSIYGATV